MGPSKDYLDLRRAEPNSEIIPGWSTSRLYFSASVTLELFVSNVLISPGSPLTGTSFETKVLIISFVTLQVVRPPSIRLIEPMAISSETRPSSLPPASAGRIPTPQLPQAQESDLLDSLTLSNNPLATIRTNPIFGSPSFQNPPPLVETEKEAEDPNAMDWIPTNPSLKKERVNPFLRAGSAPVRSQRGGGEEEAMLRKQRFFPPEEPTGLEGLLSKTVLTETPPAPGSGADTKDAGGWWKKRFWSIDSS